SLAAVSLAADLAEADDDWARSEQLYEQAVAPLPPSAPDGRWEEVAGPSVRSQLLERIVDCRLEQQRIPDALEAGFEACRDDPGNVGAQQALAAALMAAWSRRSLDPTDPCTCSSGRVRGFCCGPRESSALARFADRSFVYELQDALRPFLDRSRIAPLIAEGIRDWYQGRPPEELGDPEELEAQLAIERTLVTKGPRPEDDDYVLLDAFADDPGTPQWASRRAREWRQFTRFGLWELAETEPDPGLLLQDLVTGEFVFMAVPPEQLDRLPRWAVLAGAVMPTEGVWRTGSELVAMTHDEGRSLVADTLAIARRVMPRLVPRAAVGRLQQQIDERRAKLRARIASEDMPPMSSELAEVLGHVVAVALPTLRDRLRTLRAARPAERRNTDGDRIELITARVRLRDRGRAEEAMERHPEFSPDEHGWTWFGGPSAPAAGTIPGGDGRTVRAFIEVAGTDELDVFVNSRTRLERLIKFLRRTGAGPEVVSERRMDAAIDLRAPGDRGEVEVASGRPAHGVVDLRPAMTRVESTGT
ncbi:MAG TPA: hypothetical protein VID47_19135, partial [Actinomycetota bacterium]